MNSQSSESSKKKTSENLESRAEKISLLATMLGPDAMARIRRKEPDFLTEAQEPDAAIDPDRANWHRNRLLKRLREDSGQVPKRDTMVQSDIGLGIDNEPHPRAERTTAPKPKKVLRTAQSIDARIMAFADKSKLAVEHPAVVARLVSALQRPERVAALRSLSGPMARSIVRRMR